MAKESLKPVHDGKNEDLVSLRRRQIFEAAAVVFGVKGYHNATVSEIAREAGLGKGTIYEYVRSKKELLFLVVEEAHLLLFEQLDKIVYSQMPPEEKWRCAFEVQVNIIERHFEAAKAIMPAVKGLEQTDREWMAQKECEYISRFESIYEEGVAAGVFRDLDSFIVCRMACTTLMEMTESLTARNRVDGDVDKLLKTILDIYNHGLRA